MKLLRIRREPKRVRLWYKGTMDEAFLLTAQMTYYAQDTGEGKIEDLDIDTSDETSIVCLSFTSESAATLFRLTM